jgi:hypothetical protein
VSVLLSNEPVDVEITQGDTHIYGSARFVEFRSDGYGDVTMELAFVPQRQDGIKDSVLYTVETRNKSDRADVPVSKHLPAETN